jgi:uncharacterized protein YdeI (YjbR/CyaY-like superfamily)
MPSMPADEPLLEFPDREAWTAWLADNGESSSGVWLKLARKDGGERSLTYAEALDAALCHGWIDARKGGIDERHWRQRFTPRTARSRWSKRNRQRAEELLARGEMAPAGVREVEAARADGRWEVAYDSPATAEVPPDLQAALDADPAAREFFAGLDRANRYAILYRLQEARRPETRARRLEKFVGMLRDGRRIHE